MSQVFVDMAQNILYNAITFMNRQKTRKNIDTMCIYSNFHYLKCKKT